MSGPVLAFDGVSIGYRTATGVASAVSDVSIDIAEGEIFGLVGESGCGKTTLSMAAMGLLPDNAEIAGDIRLKDQSIRDLPESELRRLRGNEISIVVQNPLTSLDPMFSVGSQIADTIRAHRHVGRKEARLRAIELLEDVGIPDAATRYGDPPHRFSGGQRQRIVIATALANDPAVLVADEPTTALDVTIQAQILSLLLHLRREHGMAMLVITHDLGVVAEICDRMAVMYAGQIVECGTPADIFDTPRHPYTQALLAAMPSAGISPGGLNVIAGEIPNLEDPPPGCRFAPRCPHVMPVCGTRPALTPMTTGAVAACWLHAPESEPAEAGERRSA